MLNKDYYQYFPILFSLFCVVVILAIFPDPNKYLNYDDETILYSHTFNAINSDTYRSCLLISIGLLIPFMMNFVVSLVMTHSSRRKLDLYLLMLLVGTIQGINIYFVYAIHYSSKKYFWNYHLCQFLMINVICNVVSSLQMFYGKHSPKMITALFISTTLINISFLFKISSAVLQINALGFFSMACFAVSLVVNSFVAYQWYEKYAYSKQSGLQTYQQDFFALIEILMLIFYLVLYLIFESRTSFSFTNASTQNTIATHFILIAAFYGIVEMYFLRLKYQAESSVVSISQKTPININKHSLILLHRMH